jgi:hypothetical protein
MFQFQSFSDCLFAWLSSLSWVPQWHTNQVNKNTCVDPSTASIGFKKLNVINVKASVSSCGHPKVTAWGQLKSTPHQFRRRQLDNVLLSPSKKDTTLPTMSYMFLVRGICHTLACIRKNFSKPALMAKICEQSNGFRWNSSFQNYLWDGLDAVNRKQKKSRIETCCIPLRTLTLRGWHFLTHWTGRKGRKVRERPCIDHTAKLNREAKGLRVGEAATHRLLVSYSLGSDRIPPHSQDNTDYATNPVTKNEISQKW